MWKDDNQQIKISNFNYITQYKISNSHAAVVKYDITYIITLNININKTILKNLMLEVQVLENFV